MRAHGCLTSTQMLQHAGRCAHYEYAFIFVKMSMRSSALLCRRWVSCDIQCEWASKRAHLKHSYALWAAASSSSASLDFVIKLTNNNKKRPKTVSIVQCIVSHCLLVCFLFGFRFIGGFHSKSWRIYRGWHTMRARASGVLCPKIRWFAHSSSINRHNYSCDAVQQQNDAACLRLRARFYAHFQNWDSFQGNQSHHSNSREACNRFADFAAESAGIPKSTILFSFRTPTWPHHSRRTHNNHRALLYLVRIISFTINTKPRQKSFDN